MSKTVTINAPHAKDGKRTTLPISGKVAWLMVGEQRHKFLLQETPGITEVFLTHFASGYKLGSLSPIKFRNHRTGWRMLDRAAAIELIKELVASNGADRINVKLDSAPKIN